MDRVAPGAGVAQTHFVRDLRVLTRPDLYRQFNKNIAGRRFVSAENDLRRIKRESNWDLRYLVKTESA